jgi:hypothetical protein
MHSHETLDALRPRKDILRPGTLYGRVRLIQEYASRARPRREIRPKTETGKFRDPSVVSFAYF